MVLEVKKPRPMWEILFSTHHTDIGLLYIIFSITALMMGGALAIAIRTELFLPGQQLIQDPVTFARVFTVHGTNMLFLWAIPFGAGITAAAMVIFIVNLIRSTGWGRPVDMKDPFKIGEQYYGYTRRELHY